MARGEMMRTDVVGVKSARARFIRGSWRRPLIREGARSGLLRRGPCGSAGYVVGRGRWAGLLLVAVAAVRCSRAHPLRRSLCQLARLSGNTVNSYAVVLHFTVDGLPPPSTVKYSIERKGGDVHLKNNKLIDLNCSPPLKETEEAASNCRAGIRGLSLSEADTDGA